MSSGNRTSSQSGNRTSNQNGTADPSKYFQNFKTPNMDIEGSMQMHRKNMEAMAAAHQAAMESAKSAAQAQTQYMQHAMEDLSSYIREMMTTGTNYQDKMSVQSQSIKNSLKQVQDYNQEMSNIWNKSHEKVLKVVNNRVGECLDECQNIAKKATRRPL